MEGERVKRDKRDSDTRNLAFPNVNNVRYIIISRIVENAQGQLSGSLCFPLLCMWEIAIPSTL